MDGKENILKAEKNIKNAKEDLDTVHDFLNNDIIECLQTGFLEVIDAKHIDIIRKLDKTLDIIAIDFSNEAHCNDWNKIPDLKDFLNLESINISGCSKISKLPDYIVKKMNSGKLKVIGFNKT